MNAYPTKEDVTLLHQQSLANVDTQINTTQMNLKSQSASLKSMVDHAAEIDATKKPVPKFLADQITTQQTVVLKQEEVLTRQKQERATMVTEEAAEMKHYLALTAAKNAGTAAASLSSPAVAVH